MLHRFTAPWLDGSNFALDWNGPAERGFAPFDPAELSFPVFSHFEGVAKTHPDRVAADDGGKWSVRGRADELREEAVEPTVGGFD